MKGSKRVANQVELIDSVDWDVLIILDDCRYDYFKEIYPKYIKGRLIKALSPASNTYEWCKKVLENCNLKNVVYISANPYINSKKKVKDFDSRSIFHEIIDAWLIDWSDEISTVHPKDMTERLRKILVKYPRRRIIAHYMQPHFPYLSLSPEILGRRSSSDVDLEPKPSISISFPRTKRLRKQVNEALRALPLELARSILKVWEKVGGNLNAWAKAFVELGMEGMRKAYKDNIRIVLNYISQIVESCNQNVVLTSDHGELLGEFESLKQGTGHPPNRKNKELREVPWLEVSN